MLKIKLLHTLIGLMMVTVMIAGGALIGEYFTDMTFIQFIKTLISFDPRKLLNPTPIEFGFFFMMGFTILALVFFPIKRSINEFFELRFYQFN